MQSYFTIQPALLAKLTLSFVLATIVGTLSHEAGHWAVARYYGFSASIRYGYTHIGKPPENYQQAIDTLIALRKKYRPANEKMTRLASLDKLDFPEKPFYKRLSAQQKRISFWITLGGPSQTMLTGSLGLLLLATNRRWWAAKQHLTLPVWLLVFTTLFWLRQPGNLATSVVGYLKRGHLSAGRDDESKLSLALHLWQPTMLLLTGFMGLAVLGYITFRVVPPPQRVTFLLAGLVGGTFGYWFWLSWAGPVLLP